ncbi:MAG TPA: sulfur carrier protein ThiS [Pyrinomonadaceae bacterium]|jgi:sulfur carrier protein|nr:sulfur carrier protein ThiS [Pyrinomonadaceae bacterium]
MRVQINGETRDVPLGLNLEALLEHLSLPQQRVAVELNREVIRKSEWVNQTVNEDDRIEIVHFVGGG